MYIANRGYRERGRSEVLLVPRSRGVVDAWSLKQRSRGLAAPDNVVDNRNR